jgi:glycosyltransferase involved in cell wall biosynthesis
VIIQVISLMRGGGAEIIARELNKYCLSKNLNSFVIFFSANRKELKKNEITLGLNPRNPLIIIYLRKIIKKLIANRKEIVVIHAHLYWPFFYLVLSVLGLRKIKLVFTVHHINNKRNFFFKIIERLFCLSYSYIIFVSQGAYKTFARVIDLKSKKNITVIPNGSRIFPFRIRTTLKKRLPRLISIGTLNHRKNFSTSIAAISGLRNDIESYTIVGEGPQRAKLEKKIKSLKLNKKIKLIGWSDNIKQYLYQSDIMLIPSLSEAFNLAAVEGMSTGLPVVASNVDGMREVLGYQNPAITLIDKIDSIEEWQNGIHKSINDIKILGFKKISKFSNRQAKKFTFKKMGERYLKIYNKL